ncbi:Trp biosynthesis-associated membrane protein [Leucobacter sp.]
MRAKPAVLGGIALSGAAALAAGSQTWVSFMLDGTHRVETITGHAANAALTPVSVALIAAALALTIAGRVFRRVLGALVALLGAGLIALTSGVLADPLAAAGGRITELTGIAGGAAGSEVLWSDVSAWGWVSLLAGALAVALGAIVLLFSGRWGAAGRKYDSAPKAAGAPGGAPDRISDWDSLSEGTDPSDDIR